MEATMNRRSSIWIIDDDRAIRWVLEKALKNEAMDVRLFQDGESALRAMARSTPDVIVTDIRMPGLSGLDLLERIRAEQSGHPDHHHDRPLRPRQCRVGL